MSQNPADIIDGTDSGDVNLDQVSPEEDLSWLGRQPGSVIKGEIINDDAGESGKSRLKSDRPPLRDKDASGSPPNIDDWMHFFGKVVIRVASDWYIDWAFRGIDENILTDRDIDRIKLREEERDRIARPLAELAHKTKWTRKHGRSIIAASESIDALLQMGMWFSRVSRIAARYRTHQPRQQEQEFTPPPSDEEYLRERARQSEANGQQAREPGWRPPVNGFVITPGG